METIVTAQHIVEMYDKVMPETAKVISKPEIGPKREWKQVSSRSDLLGIRLTHLSQKGALAELVTCLYAALVLPLHCKSASLSLASASHSRNVR